MENRLTLSARNQLAAEIRREIIGREDPVRLENLEDPRVQPHESAQGLYAFEFLLNRYRKTISEFLRKGIDYTFGWCEVRLLIDEQNRSAGRFSRMCADMFVQDMMEKGVVKEAMGEWKAVEFNGFSSISDEQLEQFIFEVGYEIARELATEKFAEKYK